MADSLTTILSRPEELRLTIHGLRAVKRRASLTLSGLIMGVSQIDADAMTWIIWAAMLKDHPQAKVEDAENALQAHVDAGHTLEDIADLIVDLAEESGLIQKATGEAPEGEDPQTAPGESG